MHSSPALLSKGLTEIADFDSEYDIMQDVYVHAVRLAEKAASKVAKDFPGGPPAEPEIVNDNHSVRLPSPPSALGKAYFES